MKFYGYEPDFYGKEPVGSDHKVLFELKTVRGAVNKMQRLSSNWLRGFALYSYTEFYNSSTFEFRASNMRNLVKSKSPIDKP